MKIAIINGDVAKGCGETGQDLAAYYMAIFN